MNRVLANLNPSDEDEFVSVYIDDKLVYSKTLGDHLDHLRQVLQRLQEAGLMLNPNKCHFARKEVQYLTPDGVKPNRDLVKAACNFPVPTDMKGVRRFLGMTSYNCKFVPLCSKVAELLHCLTRKDTDIVWSPCVQIPQEEADISTDPCLPFLPETVCFGNRRFTPRP